MSHEENQDQEIDIVTRFQGRDMTDQEFTSLTLDERKALATHYLHIKREIFHPNMMLMASNFLKSEFVEINRDPSQREYFLKMTECMKIKNAGQQMVCIMNLDCKRELVMYTRALIQFQKSKHMCKLPKQDMLDCYQRRMKQINLAVYNKLE